MIAMTGERILAVDDEEHVLHLCRDVLSGAGYRVDTAGEAVSALRRLREASYDLVLSDLRMPGKSGLDLLEEVRSTAPDLPFVVFTGYPSVESAVEAMRGGAVDFLPKPFDNEHLCLVVRRVLDRRRLEDENRILRAQLGERAHETRIRGGSRAILKLLDLIRRAAPTDSNILILGDSGTGKELVARNIHGLSRRRSRPFVPLDCAALPEGLLESELFGHEKGAFTGALAQRQGLIESAAGGTLFLDEIGDLSVGLQAKLLRMLEERYVRRVGGKDLLPVDIRVVAATNVDLPCAIREGRFREDLYFRLNVIPIRAPSLKERMEDIPVLVEAFLEEFSQQRPEPPRKMSAEALDLLLRYPWPGNVRELRNVVERMMSLATGRVITVADVPPEILVSPPQRETAGTAAADLAFRDAKRCTVDRFEREYLHRLLAVHEGNVTQSAREAGMNRSAFQRLMRKHRLRSSAYRAAAEVQRS